MRRLILSRFAAINLKPKPGIPNYDQLIAELAADDRARVSFLRALLEKLGLEPNENMAALPALSKLHLTSINNTEVSELLCSWESIMEKKEGEEIIRGEADTFRIQGQESSFNMDEVVDALAEDSMAGGVPDYETTEKTIIPHEQSLPSARQTPHFDHKRFYTSLRMFQLAEQEANAWGNVLLYGDVVTSTNTILDKSATLILLRLPGLTKVFFQKPKAPCKCSQWIHNGGNDPSFRSGSRLECLDRAPWDAHLLYTYQSPGASGHVTANSLHAVHRVDSGRRGSAILWSRI